MGQYYTAVFLDSDGKIRAWMNAYSFRGGVKLMEHSWVGTRFMEAIEWLLSPEGYFHKSPIVWAGDYADEEETGKNLYHLCHEQEDKNIMPSPNFFVAKEYPYIVNHTKKEFVQKGGNDSIHPLSLLTAEGNGRGGGDYRGNDERLVGLWARDVISVEKEVPEGYTEFITEFYED